MKSKSISFLLISFFCVVASYSVSAQDNSDASSSTSKKTESVGSDDPMAEFKAKLKIREDKEQFDKLIKNSEEIAKLTEELTKTYEKNQKFSSSDLQKLGRMQKLSKKILNGLGAGEEIEAESDEKIPMNTPEAIKFLQEKTSKLIVELKKTTRYSISVVAIETSNAVIKIVNFLRLGSN